MLGHTIIVLSGEMCGHGMSVIGGKEAWHEMNETAEPRCGDYLVYIQSNVSKDGWSQNLANYLNGYFESNL